MTRGIFQIHCCIHGGILPLSLIDKAPAAVAADVVGKTLRSLVEEKIALSELFNYEK